MKRYMLVVIGCVLGCQSWVDAHVSICAHTHVNKRSAPCTTAGAACGKGGKCQAKGQINQLCKCHGGGCCNTAVLFFQPIVAGLPAPNTTREYAPVSNAVNGVDTFLHDVQIAAFGPEDSALNGTLTLTYGSFADPTQVPVVLEEMFLIAPSITFFGITSGPNLFRLPSGRPPPQLVYNATTGVVGPPSGESILLVTDNQLAFAVPTVVYFGAVLEPDSSGSFVLTVDTTAAEPAPAAQQNPARVSVGLSGRSGNADSRRPRMSGDGRFTVFDTAAHNFDLNDTNGASDVYCFDRVTDRLLRVSLNTAGEQADDDSFEADITDDGVLAAFVSRANNLAPGGTQHATDIYIRNLVTRMTTSVTASVAGGGGFCAGPVFSADGQHLAFSSTIDDLVPGDSNGVRDVFVADVQTEVITRVSVAASGIQGDDSSAQPSISGDGRFVAFFSNAENLLGPSVDTNGAPDIFVHDRDADGNGMFDEPGGIATVRVSVTSAGAETNPFFADRPAITPDGRFVAFASDAQDLGAGAIELQHIFVHDRDADDNGTFDEPGGIATVHVSVSSAGAIDRFADHLGPAISDAGRFVSFSSDSDNLVTGDGNGFRDAFLHDRDADDDGTFDEPGAGETSTTRISVTSGGVQGDDESGIFNPLAMAGDARFVAYETLATTLLGAGVDTNNAQDILIYDREVDTTLASVAPLPAEGNDMSLASSISDEGRYVAFMSYSDNLVLNDTNFVRDVFVFDRQTLQTERVSVDSSGLQGDMESGYPAISGDGAVVAFESEAVLVVGDGNGQPDVYTHDRGSRTTTLVSVTPGGVSGLGTSDEASTSDNGQRVAFRSSAADLVPIDLNGASDVFVRDLLAGTTTIASASTSGAQGNGVSDQPSISGDGQFVAFRSFATTLVSPDVGGYSDILVRDLAGGTTERVSIHSSGAQANGDSSHPVISADGRFVAFQSEADNLVTNDNNTVTDIFVHDRLSGTTVRVSIGSEGNQPSEHPSISDDGLRITFQTRSDSFGVTPPDMNGFTDVYMHDRRMGTTERVSLDTNNEEEAGFSGMPAISGHGQFVSFETDAVLSPEDANLFRDVYVRDLGSTSPGDFDKDGDVDLADFLKLQACMTDPGGALAPGCEEVDLDGDGDGDLADLIVFQTLFIGSR